MIMNLTQNYFCGNNMFMTYEMKEHDRNQEGNRNSNAPLAKQKVLYKKVALKRLFRKGDRVSIEL